MCPKLRPKSHTRTSFKCQSNCLQCGLLAAPARLVGRALSFALSLTLAPALHAFLFPSCARLALQLELGIASLAARARRMTRATRRAEEKKERQSSGSASGRASESARL